MASTRRPTYRPAGRSGSTATGDENGTVPASGRYGTDPDGVITASRSVPDQGSGKAAAPAKPAGREALRFRKAPKDTPAGPADKAANVLAFPEPPGKRRRRKLLMVVSAAAVLVAGLLAGAVWSPVLAVKTISVSGTRILTPEQVQAALEPLHGTPLPQISDEEVGRLLEPLVQVKSVSAEARPPSGLAVAVRERVPVALVKQGEQYQLVDVDGVQLASTDDPASVSLPVIDGGAGTIGQDLFRATAAVLGALPADVLAKLSNASAQSVDAVELKLVDGQTIVWGNASERELKAKVLEALLKVPADPKNPVRVYDVSVPRHPVTR